MARMRLNCKAWYLIFRTASFLAAALPPAIRAMQLFTVWREETVIKVQAGLGTGAVMALVLVLWVFRDTVIGTMKKHMGLVRVLAVALVYLILVGLRKAAPYIPKLEEVAFYALLGGLASWGLSAVAWIFKVRGGSEDGNAGQ